MTADREKITGIAVTIQPTPNVFNAPGAGDLIPAQTPDDGYDGITAEDPTVTGAVWNAAPIFLGSRGRAGATVPLRGPAGGALPAANAWALGRILQAAGFIENRLAAPITAAAQGGGSTSSIQLAAGESAVDDFYKGYPIQHAGIGSGLRATSMIRGYAGGSKTATLAEVLGAAIVAGNYTIPAGLFYVLGLGTAIPLLSCSVWRGRRRRDYKDCALSSFAINVPVSNDQNTDLPSIEFAMMGVPAGEADTTTPALASSMLTSIPPAKAGKFALNGVKVGHQTLRYEFGLETGAPPNQNNDNGQETYEILSGSRQASLDVNQTLLTELDLKGLADAQTQLPVLSTWGLGTMNRFGLLMPNGLLDQFSPNPRNGFVGMSGNANPADVDKSISLAVW